MKKLTGTIVLLLFLVIPAISAHLKGGWIQYEYLGAGTAANSSQYRITVRQYLLCSSAAGQIDQSISLGIFNGSTNAIYSNVIIPLTSGGSDTISKKSFDPCINPQPTICYRIDRYVTTVELPNIAAGYILAVQRCCRIQNIINLTGSGNVGVSYFNKIPGTINGVDYFKNSSPVFAQKDTAVVCHNAMFSFDFSATDADNDQITYSFCDGLTGGSFTAPKPNPPNNPPYDPIPYSAGYSGSSPLGPNVTINPNTGIISGIAPSVTGDYVVAVCANEFRNGVLIGSTKKEIHISVADCSIAGASLKPLYINCKNATMNFQNESTNPSIISYLWDFGEKNGSSNFTSTQPTPTHTYKDSGAYVLKLTVTGSGGCKDSATSLVKIYPGFVPGFTAQGNCFLNPFKFFDATVTKYGTVNSWRWNLGDSTNAADTATGKDTAWLYHSPVNTQVRLIVTSSKGCIDTITKPVIVSNKPVINLAFRDTLICSNDTLPLKSTISNGSVLWTPNNTANLNRIQSANTANPLVYPRDTTVYNITVNDHGCINSDSVRVNVLQFIKVKAGSDTVICQTDQFNLHPVSDALSYNWTTSTGITVSNTKYPLVQPLTSTTYYIVANLGKCQDRDSVKVKVAPYPKAAVGNDTTLCFGNRLQLHGTITGAAFTWTPTNTLIYTSTLNPVAGPVKTTSYVLTVIDTLGCNKSSSDTIVVTVIPPLTAHAGHDTSVAVNQPLQLIASGGSNYAWSPITGLSNPSIFNPVATLAEDIDSIRYTVRVSEGACYAEDHVMVRVYKNGPDIFIPSAFTPNGDGRNDVLKPITVGITKLFYFKIFNRWGQLVFYTNEIGKGWDGEFSGVKQPSGTYVFEVSGTDYLGNMVYRKGTTVLIR